VIPVCGRPTSSLSEREMMSKSVATLILFALVGTSPTARAEECFCLSHSTGAILRGCESYKAATDFYSTAVCTDPETGKRSQQTMYSDWKRIEAGADRCAPCQRASRRATDEVPRGGDDAPKPPR
jgi:hypothetical protein